MPRARKIDTPAPATETTVSIDDSRLASLLCTGFEGGMTRHWCRIMRQVLPADPKPVMDGEQIWPSYDYPLCGGATVCRLYDGETKQTDGRYKPLVLDRAAIDRGLAIMAAKYPRHFADIIADNEDAITGDVFIQCCLLGSVVYG